MITLYDEKDQKLKLLSVYEVSDADMGESSISVTVSFAERQDFHPDWYVIYNGEKFRLGVRKPTGKKDTSSLQTTYTLVFKSEREDLKRYTFMDFVELGSGNPQPNSYKVSLYTTLTEFVDRFNTNLAYYMGARWKMVLPSDYVEQGNAVSFSLDNATLWDVLIKVYEVFGLRWVIREENGVLLIKVGFPEVEIEHVFEYGKGNGLVSVERNNALERIITRLRGRGGEKNLPPDYFHTGDPDTNSFLQATYFQNLMPKTYRDYIRGYNAGSGTGSWAYNQGVADKVSGTDIAPVDYVISDNEDLWGISYGTIEPNESIFPTLQGATRNGVKLDEVLYVEPVLVDGVTEPLNTIAIGLGAGADENSVGTCGTYPWYMNDCRKGIDFILFSDKFAITNPINKVQIRLTATPSVVNSEGLSEPTQFGDESAVRFTAQMQLVDFSKSVTGEVIRTYTVTDEETFLWELEDIPISDEYRLRANIVWSADILKEDVDEQGKPILVSGSNVVVGVSVRLTGAMVYEYARASDKGEFKSTFDIEIRDVWNIAREEGESDEDYTYRVWSPRAVTEEMAVMFSDGLLAGEDYEFPIVGFSSDSDNLEQVITSAIKPTSEGGWRLTLQKSEAEAKASNMYLPNTMQNAKAGDHFFFINIAMPYDPYVYDAEARVSAYLDEQLVMKNEEFPSFTINPSKIFCAGFSEAGKLQAGAKIRVRNTELIGESYISLYIQSLTKRYSANSLNPEWSLTISDQVVASGNPVDTLQGNVDVLAQIVYSNRQSVKEAVRALSNTFLHKDGMSEVSYSPTEFRKGVKLGLNGITDKEFVNGDLTGKGFGVYTDGDGNRVIEADILVGRIGARFNEVKINQVTYSAGKQVFSSAGMVVSRVEDAGTSWRCYFDTKNSTERNYFSIGDGAFSQRFTDAGVRQYWARVTAIGADWIEISKTDRMSGSFDPIVGDNVAQLGNSTDKSRQAALMIDETRDGGGLVTWYDDITDFTLSEKDSVNIGRIDGKTWLQVYGAGYIGDREETQYVKYENGVLRVKGRLEVGTTLSDGRDLEQAIKDAKPEDYEEFVQSVTKSLGDLQNQVDGAIDSYFLEYDATLDNYPANEWDTDSEKQAHLGDTFTNNITGDSWRWGLDSSGNYAWIYISDTATKKALETASKAQDTADGKRRVFITQPTPPYDLGDLWAGGSSEPLRRCIIARDSGSFDASDWDYADSTQAQIAEFEYLKRALGESTTIDGGLIQSALLMLGYTDSSDTFHIMSGTNGLYDSEKLGGGIAAWYGGPMADKESDNALKEFAQALFRFDGSGYLAGGNITWDKDGAGSVAGGNFSWDKNGRLYLKSNVIIGDDENETFGGILSALSDILNWFELRTLEDGQTVLVTKHNLASEKNITAGGVGGGADESSILSMGQLVNVDSAADEVSEADKILVKLAGQTHWTMQELSELVGLDEEALLDYLTNNEYIQKSDLADYAKTEDVISKDALFTEVTEENGTTAQIIKKDLLPKIAQGAGVIVKDNITNIEVSLSVNDTTFGFDEENKLQIKLIDGGIY